jgi:hypothetical protein
MQIRRVVEYRLLGRTGWKVSEISFGAWTDKGWNESWATGQFPVTGVYQAVSAFPDSLRPSFHQSDPESSVSFWNETIRVGRSSRLPRVKMDGAALESYSGDGYRDQGDHA